MQNLNKVPSNTSETKTYGLSLAALLTRDEQSMKKRNININIIIIIIIRGGGVFGWVFKVLQYVLD